MNFSAYLKRLREQREITKSRLARALQVTAQYVVDIEAGRSKPPTSERCEQIGKFLRLHDEEKEMLLKLAMRERLPRHSISYIQKISAENKSNLKVMEPEADYVIRSVQKIMRAEFKAPSPRKNIKGLGEAGKKLWGGREIYLVRVPDNSLSREGLKKGDWAIVDRSAKPRRGELVAGISHGKTLIRRYDPSKRPFSPCAPLRGILWKGWVKRF